VVAFGVERLAITDLVDTDLALIGWSGSELHVRDVARELERAANGEAEYLAVRGPDGTPIAKCGIDFAAVPGAGVIHQLATRADLHGLGIGTNLIAAAEARIRARGLMTALVNVERDNPRARALYERLGFVPCGERAAAWEAQADDGSTFVYETELTDMKKPL
jgi:ribosomal protein S18 acetylase RimI-like enzyme